MQYDGWWKTVLLVVDYWRKHLVFQALTKIHLAVVLAFFLIFGVFFLSFCSWRTHRFAVVYCCCSIRGSGFVRFFWFFPEKYTACKQKASTEHHPILVPGKQIHGLYKQSFWRCCLSHLSLSFIQRKQHCSSSIVFSPHCHLSPPCSSILQWQQNPRQKTLSCSAFVVAPFVVATKNQASKAGGRRSSYKVVHT